MENEQELAIAEYRKLLAHHDWFYAFSDDDRVYRSGRDAQAKLRELHEKLDPDMIIWNEYDK